MVPNTRDDRLGPVCTTTLGARSLCAPTASAARATFCVTCCTGRMIDRSFCSARAKLSGAVIAQRCAGPASWYAPSTTAAMSTRTMIAAPIGALMCRRTMRRMRGLNRKLSSTAKAIGMRNSRAK